MKKLIYFVVLVFITLEVSKIPAFQAWINKMEQKVITKAENTVKKTSLMQITTDLSLLNILLSNEEMSYLTNNISTMAQAKSFKVTYCNNKLKLSHNVLTSYAFEQACNILNKHLESTTPKLKT